MKHFIRWAIEFLFLAMTLGVMSYFWGEVHITSTLDGDKLSGLPVEIDGKVVGKTPYTTRFFLSSHKIKVEAPEDMDCRESGYQVDFITVVLGMDIKAEFHTRK